MTSLICAISNEVPENPVVSPVSGQVCVLLNLMWKVYINILWQVFERRLIEKFLADNGVDPTSRIGCWTSRCSLALTIEMNFYRLQVLAGRRPLLLCSDWSRETLPHNTFHRTTWRVPSLARARKSFSEVFDQQDKWMICSQNSHLLSLQDWIHKFGPETFDYIK